MRMGNFSHKSAQVDATLVRLFKDAKFDRLNMIRGAVSNVFGPLQPADFATAYLSISPEQGKDLEQLIRENNLKNVVEFGTSFGISTLFLAKGVLATGGQVITTELIESKGRKARENFKSAGVADLIEVRIGDALETLKNYAAPIDLLLLDGWKDLYLPLFQLLEPNFHANTFIYVDNADMADTQAFLNTISLNPKYQFQSMFGGKAVLINIDG